MVVGCTKWWFTASTVIPQHIWALPYPNFPNFGPHLHRYNSVRIIIIIIIILLHYHKGLSAVGLSLPTDSLGLQSIIACVLCLKGVFQLCKATEKNIQLGAGERGGRTERDNVRVDCFVFFYVEDVYRP